MQTLKTHSLAVSIALLPEKRRQEAVNSLTDEEALALLYDWEFWARPKQLPPDWDWFCWLLLTGRGFGKTRTGAEWVINRAKSGPYHPIALIAETKADARDVMVEIGESSILQISPSWFMPKYEPSKRRLTWPNGMVAVIYSGDEPDQLRGPQHGSAWVDELAKFKYPSETWDNLELGLRQGDKPQVVVTTTPRPIPIIKELVADARSPDNPEGAVHVTSGSSYENIHNLATAFVKRVLKKYEGTYLGRQEIHAEVLEDAPGALWKRAEMLEKHRVTSHPELYRIAVGVDPHAGAGETGIVAAGVATIGDDVHGYILEDATIGGSPATWAGQTIAVYNRYRADRVIGEANQGGDMVEQTIRSVEGGKSVAYKKVWASRGKQARAEPVAALYERGLVHHVGTFALLEDELCSWVPGEGMPSPNRLDALVWALMELMVEEKQWKEVEFLKV